MDKKVVQKLPGLEALFNYKNQREKQYKESYISKKKKKEDKGSPMSASRHSLCKILI